MTSKLQETRQEQYGRMLAQAKRDLLMVRGHGTVKATGDAVYAVQSKSEPNRLHLVRVRGLDLQCDCVAAQYGRYCGHRALVRARLELESQVRQDTREREIERAFHEAARELDVQIDITVAGQAQTVPASALNRSPKPRDDTRVFSIYK